MFKNSEEISNVDFFTDESLKNLPSENKNEFVLIPTQALQLACIPIGDPVLVSLGKNIQFIKTAWPAGDKKSSLLSVAVSKEGSIKFFY